ncbi:electron transport complex protein RnfC [Pseudomonas linyingensis]|uniref:Ion-translocating oxidoreductase complex subunit C n=1 Tax=Pseudomonas linyingensis TaxID=915471 RepID=A0A1H7CBY5_9PSED|nr:electron transport complex subunit RsxC [Pseudomonas linyingensis]SEJ86966.1 electron transport complex protein RnfC [Pseudomonas linyingensis]
MTAAVKTWDIPGGIHPPERKTLSNRTPIQVAPLPKRLILPLAQHIGAPAEPCVAVGERVLKGQKIADAAGFVSVAVHAPTSGTVTFIGPQPYPHASGMLAPAIVIEADGLDQWCALEPCADFRSLAPQALLAKIRDAGINGLGGAGFPTAVKLTARPLQKIHTLILNGTECEPYITADDMLMRERASELVSGIDILAQLIQPDEVLIGIEDNKPEAIAALRAALSERAYQLRVFPTKYPSGGEKQLIQILTGREVPAGGLPADIGILCQNVGTAVAIHDAVVLGKPLIARITTLTGEALARPMNVEALIGTPVQDLLAFAGLDEQKLDRLIMGGPMMGVTLPALDVPLIKTSNCLLAPTRSELPPPQPALPCIRCGDCALACPASLLPQQLHFFALGQEHEQLKAHNLFDCIECGACAYVCPSSIPLVQYYRAAKAEIRELEQKQQKAEHSKQRFELRQERLRREEERKEAERKARAEKAARAKAAQAEAAAAAPVASAAPAVNEDLKRLKIEASMAQVALKKAEKQLAQHDTPELQAQVGELRTTLETAQKALADAQAAAPVSAPAPAAKPAGDEALKKAKIEAAMLKAKIRKLEKVETPDDAQQAELAKLREQQAKAEKALAAAESSAPAAAAATTKPAGDEALKKAKIEAAMLKAQIRKLEKLETPDDAQQAELAKLREQLTAAEQALATLEQQSAVPVPADEPVKAEIDPLKKAKVELAMKRAELKKAEKAGADEGELSRLRDALAAAEQTLHGAEEASNKPAPELVRTDKRPVDEATRALKTEVAFARADLRKLERDESAAAEALEAARTRLAEAELKLAEQQSS